LVQYSLINDELLYTWVIQPSGTITFRSVALDPAVPIDKQIADSRSAIGARGRIKVVQKGTKPVKGDANLSQLHRILVEPIADQLPQDPNQRVVFLPQGPLYFVPFPALRDGQGKYLIENHTISTAPSIQTLEFTQAKNKQPRANGTALVVGDPTMPWFEAAQLPALPGARQEAINIANILKTQPLIGDQATKTAVLEQIKTASTIHLATHGLLSKVSGDAPGAVALAPSGQDKGFLTASEIFDLNLNANLVVLSACDTARGEVTSDGVVGLSRSLIAAGVPSVVVSLWAVDDQSTSALMGDFYRNLQHNPDKAQAMRQAMLSTMKQYPHPLDWAAFTLVGESE
jgi:CHAT domain-containing protein